MSFAELINEQSRRHRDDLCLTCADTGRSWTYGNLDEMSRRAARRLREAGVESGDRVGLRLGRTPEFFVWMFAAARMGAVTIPIGSAMDASMVPAFLRAFEAKACVFTSGRKTAAMDAIVSIYSDDIGETMEDGFAAVPRDAACVLFYSSGTTAKPSAIVHSQDSLTQHLSALSSRYRFDAAHRALSFVFDFDSVLGLSSTVLSAYACGGQTVLSTSTAVQEGASLIWDIILRYQISSLYLSPAVAARLLESGSRASAASLRFSASTGSALTSALARRWGETFGSPLINVYGSTETGLISAQSLDPNSRRDGDAGRPDPDTVRVLAGSGEIIVRGPRLMQGYFDDPARTASAVREGWYHTGDVGRIDQDGYLFVDGRLGDRINRGGQKIYPTDVNAALDSHPSILEAATFGIPDPAAGEEVVSCVVLRPGRSASADELLTYLRELLPSDRLPGTIRFVASLPRNALGKVLLRELSGRP